MLKAKQFIWKHINFFITLNLLGILIFGLFLLYFALFLKPSASVERRNFGFGSKSYFDNQANWNLSYIDDAKNAKLVNFVNEEKEKTNGNVMYQLNVYGFSDGNGDGIGDLIGAKNHLDYLDDLGIGLIWLSPIHISPSYHGYDVMDYTAVSAEYGGMQAFNAFLKAAHNRGIRVYLDMVFNHSSAKHPWFAKAINDPNSKYRNYYKFGSGQSARNAGYDSDAQFYSAFNWHGMPDLNLSNLNVLNELNAVLEFWTKKGVDGFRFDAFKHFYDEGRDSSVISGGIELFSRFKAAVNKASLEINRQINDVQLMGEGLGISFGTAEKYVNYQKGTKTLPAMDGVYDPDYWTGKMPVLYKSVVDTINYRSQTLQKAGEKSKQNRRLVPWIPYLENHDSSRWLAQMRTNKHSVDNDTPLTEDDKTFAKSAYATLIFAPGRPIIYQGGELGYHAPKRSDPYVREPLTWSNESQIEFYDYNIYSPQYELNTNNDPIKLTSSKDVGTADYNQRDKDSIFGHIKAYLDIKAKYKWLDNPKNPLFPLSTIQGLSLIDGGIRKNITTNEEIIWLGSNINEIYDKKEIKMQTYDLAAYINNRKAEVLHSSKGALTNDLSNISVPRNGTVVLRIFT